MLSLCRFPVADLIVLVVSLTSSSARVLHGKKLVVACNGFADARSTAISERPKEAQSLRQRTGQIQLRRARGKEDSPHAEPVWSQYLEYGECAEFHVDFSTQQLFFEVPNGEQCGVEATFSNHTVGMVAVVAQPDVASKRCVVRTVSLKERDVEKRAASAELAVVDAYTPAKEDTSMRAIEADTDFARVHKNALEASMESDLLPLDGGGVLRLEDRLEENDIATEVIGSQTLYFSRTFSVEPKEFFLVLENLRGSSLMDKIEVDLEAAQTYVAIRTGRYGDTSFPQRLVMYACKECVQS